MGAAEGLEGVGGVLGLRVDVVVGAQLAGEGLLVGAAGEGDRVEAHLGGVLHAEVAETAEAQDRDAVAGAGAAVAERVVGRDAGAEEGAGVGGGQVVGDAGGGLGGDDDVVGPAAVVRDAGDALLGAVQEVAGAAGVAGGAVAAVPPDPDAVAGLPGGDALADGGDPAGDLVAGHAGELEAGEAAGGDEDVAVADAAGLDGDADLAGARRGGLTLDDLQGTVGLGDGDTPHVVLLLGVVGRAARGGRRSVGRYLRASTRRSGLLADRDRRAPRVGGQGHDD